MKKVTISFMLFAFAALLMVSCFPYRESSESQKLDQAIGMTQGAGTAVAQLLTQQAQEGTVTPDAPWYQELPPSVGDVVGQTIGTLVPGSQQPPPELKGPPLFFVTTKGSGGWTNNLLFSAPGVRVEIQQTDPETFFGLGSAGTSGWIAEVTHAVELGVYDTANMSDFYLTQPTVWMEFSNLVGRANAGVGSTDTTIGVSHTDTQHKDPEAPQTHAHGFSEPKDDREHLIMVIVAGTPVIIVQVDEQARMAEVKLPPLWIDSKQTQPAQ